MIKISTHVSRLTLSTIRFETKRQKTVPFYNEIRMMNYQCIRIDCSLEQTQWVEDHRGQIYEKGFGWRNYL